MNERKNEWTNERTLKNRRFMRDIWTLSIIIAEAASNSMWGGGPDKNLTTVKD